MFKTKTQRKSAFGIRLLASIVRLAMLYVVHDSPVTKVVGMIYKIVIDILFALMENFPVLKNVGPWVNSWGKIEGIFDTVLDLFTNGQIGVLVIAGVTAAVVAWVLSTTVRFTRFVHEKMAKKVEVAPKSTLISITQSPS